MPRGEKRELTNGLAHRFPAGPDRIFCGGVERFFIIVVEGCAREGQEVVRVGGLDICEAGSCGELLLLELVTFGIVSRTAEEIRVVLECCERFVEEAGGLVCLADFCIELKEALGGIAAARLAGERGLQRKDFSCGFLEPLVYCPNAQELHVVGIFRHGWLKDGKHAVIIRAVPEHLGERLNGFRISWPEH